MDIATVIGLVAGNVLLLLTIMMGSSIATFISIPSVFVTIGGSVSALFIHFPMEKVKNATSVAQKAFFHKSQDPAEIIAQILEFSAIARREGVLALEEKMENVEDQFIKKGIQMVVDGSAPEVTREILEIDMSFLEDRHKDGKEFFDALGAYAPAFGMIGTLIGLVQMLQNMEDPSSIGAGMAVALLTTLYGAVVANLVALPIAGKLKVRSNEEMLLRNIVIEGVQSIQLGESPRVVEDKLKVFLPPKTRSAIGKKEV